MKIIEEILGHASQLLKMDAFIAAHRLNSSAFVRRRKLPFDRIASTLIHLAKNSLQIVCNKLGDYFQMEVPASKQAFSQARLNLSYSCFQALNDQALQTFYTRDVRGLWKDYRVFAADGSTLRLPESSDTLAHFGRWDRGGENRSENCPVMGRISEFTDVASGFIVSAALLPWCIGEQTMAGSQLGLVVEKMREVGQEKLLFIYDRGYPSKDFFSLHHQLKVDFVFRVPRGFNKALDALGGSETKVLQLYEGMPPFRAAVYELSSGEKEVLLTSVVDQDLFSYEELFNVYGARWRTMEEGYKRQKVHFELQNWATKSVMGILQEFWGKKSKKS